MGESVMSPLESKLWSMTNTYVLKFTALSDFTQERITNDDISIELTSNRPHKSIAIESA